MPSADRHLNHFRGVGAQRFNVNHEAKAHIRRASLKRLCAAHADALSRPIDQA
jgi:hypothetical protein